MGCDPYLLGIDVSYHQGDVDFRQVAQSGMRFAVAKCTEGKDYIDPRFKDQADGAAGNWTKLVALDPDGDDELSIFRGSYHFARQDLRPEQGRSAGEIEGRWYASVLKAFGDYGQNCLPPALDWEKWAGTPSTNIEWIRGFLDVVETELGRRCMIYTGPNVWASTTGNSDAFVDRVLWEVKYRSSGSEPCSQPPRMLGDDGTHWPWEIWQWSGGGQWAYYGPVPGIPGAGVCDVNNFVGDEAALLALATPGTEPPPPPGTIIWPAPPDQLDLADLEGKTSLYTARVQGLLLAHGYGPDGLVDSGGLPDGRAGPKTEQYLREFKTLAGLQADTQMDWRTWRMLVERELHED